MSIKNFKTIEDHVSAIKQVTSDDKVNKSFDELFGYIDEFNHLPEDPSDLKKEFTESVVVIKGDDIIEQVKVLNSHYLDESGEEKAGHIQYNIHSGITTLKDIDSLSTILFINESRTIQHFIPFLDPSIIKEMDDSELLAAANKNDELKSLTDDQKLEHVKEMISYELVIRDMNINLVLSYAMMKKFKSEDLAIEIVKEFKRINPKNMILSILCSEEESELFKNINGIQYI